MAEPTKLPTPEQLAAEMQRRLDGRADRYLVAMLRAGFPETLEANDDAAVTVMTDRAWLLAVAMELRAYGEGG